MRFPSSRLATLACLCSLFWAAHAIAAPLATEEFAVSAAQMQALGITLTALDKPSAIGGMIYPARVVVPAGNSQVVSTPFGGRVEELLVDEQQVVKAGQPLLRLSSPEYGDLQLKLLEASSKARLSSQTASRERQLFAEGIIAQRRVQEADAAYQEAAARLRFAQASLRLAGVDPASIEKMGSGASLQDSLLVRAKSAGTVVELLVKTGQRIQSSDALLRVINTQQLWLDIQTPVERAQLPQAELLGSSVTVVGRAASATTVSVGAVVSDNQTVTLRARVDAGVKSLRLGEVVQVQVPFAANAAGWALPLSAVARQDGKVVVFVRTEKGFVAKPVSVISSAAQFVQVSGDLRAGQQVASGSVVTLKAAWLGKSGGN